MLFIFIIMACNLGFCRIETDFSKNVRLYFIETVNKNSAAYCEAKEKKVRFTVPTLVSFICTWLHLPSSPVRTTGRRGRQLNQDDTWNALKAGSNTGAWKAQSSTWLRSNSTVSPRIFSSCLEHR